MDRASSGKSDPPCFKQDQIVLFYVQRRSALFRASRDRHSERAAIAIPSSTRSAVPTPGDFLIVIRSEPTIAITSERRFSSPRNDYFHGSESARDSRFVGPAFELGKLQLEQKQYAGAMDWFRRVPASDPNYAEARFKIGVAAHSAGQATTAADCFRDVLRSYPVSELYNNLGAAELAGGQSNAADEFRRALDSDPENSTYLFHRKRLTNPC